MTERGWMLTLHGLYGPESRRACELLQAEERLSVDGTIRPETWNASWDLPVPRD